MRNNVVILNLIKKEILIKNIVKKKKYRYLYVFASISSLIMVIGIIFAFGFGRQVAYVYNPVNSLYNDNSNIVFTSAMANSEKLDFRVPILSSSVQNNNGIVEFVVDKSIIVSACESGVVIDFGVSNNGAKFIKIKHNENIYSIIENVDIIGVVKFDIVKKGQDIATGKFGESVKLTIYENDNLITNIKINQSKITWQN